MGLIRKMMSVSTAGGVKYTSKREAQTKQAIAEARLLKAQTEAITGTATEQTEALAIEHVDAYLRGSYPKWRLTVRERVLLRAAEKERG